MAQSASANPAGGPRHSILDLAPLELECMNALWPMGESTVREIHLRLAVARPRAYTTVMTIMDRLTQKGVVTRRKVGRAYRYQPNLSLDEARVSALEKIVAGFFHGSSEALAAHLAARDRTIPVATPLPAKPEFAGREPLSESAAGPSDGPIDARDVSGEESAPSGEESMPQGLDETLL